MDDADVPNLKKTFLSGLHHLIPIFVLIYLLVYMRYTASYSIFYATLSLILVNLVNRLIKNSDFLKLPHPRCHLRNFVLYPILQIDPDWVHLIIKKNVKFLINNLDQKSRIDITRLNKNVIIER